MKYNTVLKLQGPRKLDSTQQKEQKTYQRDDVSKKPTLST